MIACTCVDCRMGASADTTKSTEGISHAMRLNMSFPPPPDTIAIDSKDLISQPLDVCNLVYTQCRRETSLQSQIPTFDGTTDAPQMSCMLNADKVEVPYPKVSPFQDSRVQVELGTGRSKSLLEIDETALHQSSPNASNINPPHANTPASTNSKPMLYYIRKAQERIKAQQPLRLPHPNDRVEYCEEQDGIHPNSYEERNKKPIACKRTENPCIRLFPSPSSPSTVVSDLDAIMHHPLQKSRIIPGAGSGANNEIWQLRAPSPSSLPDPSHVFIGSGGMLGIDKDHCGTVSLTQSSSSSPSCSESSMTSLNGMFETSVTSTEPESGNEYSLPPIPSPSPKLDIMSRELARFLRELHPSSKSQKSTQNNYCQTERCSVWFGFADVLEGGRIFHALEKYDPSSVHDDSGVLTLGDAMLYERPKPKSSL